MNANEFVDAQEMARIHPATLEAPTAEELASIFVGDNVKVCIGGERFWTLVQAIDGDKITAEVNNVLICTEDHGLVVGDIVQFEKRHVYAVFSLDMVQQ